MRGWLEPARVKEGLSRAEMAKRLDLSESYYAYIENGQRQKRMDITLVAKLSAVLGIPVEEIIELEMEGTAEAGA